MSNSTKTLYTCAWGGHWEKFGQQWISQIQRLNTQPDQIFVVSDKPLDDCPYEVIIADPNSTKYTITAFRQAAVDNTKCDWYCPSDIDDQMLPNYLDDINDDFDIHGFAVAGMHQHRVNNVNRYWSKPFEADEWVVPFCGLSFVKANKIKQVGIVDIGWQDQSLWMNLMFIGCKPFVDKTQRMVYNTDAHNSLMKQTNTSQKELEHRALYQELKKKYTQNH